MVLLFCFFGVFPFTDRRRVLCFLMLRWGGACMAFVWLSYGLYFPRQEPAICHL
jgi:hypothetical protein